MPKVIPPKAESKKRGFHQWNAYKADINFYQAGYKDGKMFIYIGLLIGFIIGFFIGNICLNVHAQTTISASVNQSEMRTCIEKCGYNFNK